MEMNQKTDRAAGEFARLDSQVERLIGLCNQLRAENTLLRERQVTLVAERARLIEKNEVARTRVESMITRLRALEGET
jgi:cell division protein ZapB